MDVTSDLDEKPRCKGIKKDGSPCPAHPTGNITPGYCWGHDPGITSEMRASFARKELNVPKITGKRRLRSVEDVKDWIQEMVQDIEARYPNSIEVVEVKCNLARILLTAIREGNDQAEKKAKNKSSAGAFRMKGVV